MLTKEEAIKLLDDIDEIQDIINRANEGYQLDRKKAEDIIRKHNQSDQYIAAYNSSLRPGFVTFQQATDRMYLNNLNAIQDYLRGKLIGKTVDKRRTDKQKE